MEKGQRRRHHGGRGAARDARRVGDARCVAVVPAYDAESTLARTLRSLLVDNVDYVDAVIVVASAGDGTGAVAARFDGVRVVQAEGRLSAGQARNLGLELAGGSGLVLFVDADCQVAPGAVGLLLDALHQSNCAAVAASVACAGSRPVARLRHLLEFKDVQPGAGSRASWRLPSATLLCRADAVEACGGFPDMWPGEDWVLCERLHERGLRVLRSDDAVSYHLHPPGWKELLRHQYRLGCTSAAARAMTGMQGAVFVRRPALAPLLLVGRAARGLLWMLANQRRRLPFFFLALPLYLAGLATWTAGFTSTALKQR